MRVCFIVRSLDTGGAERQLVELVRALPESDFAWTILTFYPGGSLERDVAAQSNVSLVCLGKVGRWDTIPFLRRALREIRRANPHVIHGCLGVANEVALLCGRLLRRPVIWWLGAAYMDFSLYDWALRAVFRMGALLSRFPDAIVINSCAGLVHHERHGWNTARMTVIANGFDLVRFQRDEIAGEAMRRRWGIPPGTVLVGLVARLDPIKDHETFLAAVARLVVVHPSWRFVCVGDGPPPHAARLRERARDLGLDDAVVWAGPCDDMPGAYSALDVGCLTSIGEGLPNAVGEAMSCGVPCVVSDVGDCAALVGDTGIVVPPRAPDDLARAIAQLAGLPAHERGRRGRDARARIEARYSRERYAAASAELLAAVAQMRSAPGALVPTLVRLREAACK